MFTFEEDENQLLRTFERGINMEAGNWKAKRWENSTGEVKAQPGIGKLSSQFFLFSSLDS